MRMRTKKEVGPVVGLPRHRHFVGFFNVPGRINTDTGPPHLYGYSEKPPHLVAFYDTLGDTEDRRTCLHVLIDQTAVTLTK